MTKENLPEEKLLKLIRIKRPDKDKQKTQALPKVWKKFEFKHILNFVNVLLAVAALFLVGFLVYCLFFGVEQKERATPEPVSSLKTEPTQGAMEEKKPFDYYKAQFLKRDLFERPLDQVAANASVDLTKRYKLVGIVLGDIPEAIIEDSSTKSTMFVHPGEKLDTVEVKTIEEGRIIFLQEGLEIELKQ